MAEIVKSWKVNFFQTARGDFPVKDFLNEQDETTHAKILHSIALLKNKGPFLKPPFIKKLKDKLYELRISATVEIRIFYTMHQKNYILLHGFKKKSQKTPSKEIKTAVDRVKELI